MRLIQVFLCLLTLGSSLNTLSAEPADQPALSTAASPTSYQVRNKKYGQLLRPEDANSANGTRIVLYPAQMWKCMTWKFYPAGEAAFQLQNHFTSKTFTTDAKGGSTQLAVVQVPFAKEENKRPSWQFTRLADGTYKITEPSSGKVLTAIKEESGFGMRIAIDSWQEKDEQKWELLKTDPKQLTM